MTSINFSEMYLVPRDIYLRVLENSNKEGGDSLLFNSINSGKPGIVQHQFHHNFPQTPPGVSNNQTEIHPTPQNSEHASENGQNNDIDPHAPISSSNSTRPNSSESENKSERGGSRPLSSVHEFDGDVHMFSSTGLTESDVDMSDNSMFKTPTPPSHSPKGDSFMKYRDRSSSSRSSSNKTSVSSKQSRKSRKEVRKIGENYPSFDKTYAKEKIKLTDKSSSSSSSSKKFKKRRAKNEPYPSVPPQFSKEDIGIRRKDEVKNLKAAENKKRVSAEALTHIKRLISSEQNPYILLDIPEKSSLTNIKKAFKRISVLVHPDKCQHKESHSAFTKLFNAYETLIQGKYESKSGSEKEQAFRKDYSYSHEPSNSNQQESESAFRSFRTRKQKYRSNSSADVKARAEDYGEPFHKYFKQTTPPKQKRGPPTTPLRPPTSARNFQEKFGFGLGKWLKL